MVGEFNIGDNVTVAAHSLVNKGFESNLLVVGSPAEIKRDNYSAWYVRDGERFIERVNKVKKLKAELFFA